MRLAGLFVITVAIVSAQLLGAEPEYKGDVTDVSVVRRVEQQPGASLVWEPYIAELGPKEIVVAFGAGIPGKGDMGDILACTSTDDGKTWTDSVYIFNHNERVGPIHYAYANPILFKPPGQNILWCFGMRCPMTMAHSEDSQLCASFSVDSGRSWTPVELAMYYTQPLIVVCGIQVIQEDGHPVYLLPAHRNTRRADPIHGDREQFVLASTSLLSWKLKAYIPREGAAQNVFCHEGSIAEGDAPGELKMVCRTCKADKEGAQLDPPRAFSSTSRDGGKTWTDAVQEPDLWNSVSKGFFGKSQLGQHFYIYNDGPNWSRTSMRYKVQPAGGAWGEEKTFYDAGIHNSYPTLIEHAPGEFYCVWDSGTKDRSRTQIHFGKLKLEVPK